MGGPETTMVSGGSPPAGGRFLLVVGEGHVGTHPLPDGKTLLVGRDAECDVPLNHPKISRRHARLEGGPPLEVVDLGSTNGIRVAGQRVAQGARAALRPGESFQVGPFACVVLETPDQVTPDAPLFAAISVTDPTPHGVSDVITRVAQGSVSVLIGGETGTGKEVLARTLHKLSGRTGRFVAINCATLSDALLESELFGHERGAFTGAGAAKPGLFEVAAGGTVLLDEIGDLPAGLQAKLLRAIETREIYRIGAVKPVALDVRFLAASNRDLGFEVSKGRFRRDLFFRINGITLTLRPLRERREIIAQLAAELLGEVAGAAGQTAPRLEASALSALTRHDWPGNVRELRTVMERALLLAGGAEIRAGQILLDRIPGEPIADTPVEPPGGQARLLAAAAAHRGNVTSIAKVLGTSRSQVRRLAERYGIDLERYR